MVNWQRGVMRLFPHHQPRSGRHRHRGLHPDLPSDPLLRLRAAGPARRCLSDTVDPPVVPASREGRRASTTSAAIRSRPSISRQGPSPSTSSSTATSGRHVRSTWDPALTKRRASTRQQPPTGRPPPPITPPTSARLRGGRPTSAPVRGSKQRSPRPASTCPRTPLTSSSQGTSLRFRRSTPGAKPSPPRWQ